MSADTQSPLLDFEISKGAFRNVQSSNWASIDRATDLRVEQTNGYKKVCAQKGVCLNLKGFFLFSSNFEIPILTVSSLRKTTRCADRHTDTGIRFAR